MPVPEKSRPPPSLLGQPKMRPVASRLGNRGLLSTSDKAKKTKLRKPNGVGKYDILKKTAIPDYTDAAYREAVSRLRYLLNESYDHGSKYQGSGKPEESDEESGVSLVVSDRTRTARLSPYRRQPLPQRPFNAAKEGSPSPENMSNPAPPELMAFIERQEEYIDQLEKESQYCRDELSQLLRKVKELIAENEALHEQQKSEVMKGVLNGLPSTGTADLENRDKFKKRLEGPLIVFESRISELEAQLTQSKIDLRKAQEEAEMYKKKLEETNPMRSTSEFFKQIENLQREKKELHESLTKLQETIVQIREKEMDASKKVQRTLDVVDKTQFEKQQAEMEVNRLKSELEHQHDKLLEVISEQTRKLAEERNQAERRYLQHVEQLNHELTNQRDANSKLQLELEKRARLEEDLKRDLSAKSMTIENVKKELNNKIASLQNDLSTALAERDSIEQELNTSRMSGERTDRLNRQESSRQQIEISSLRQRLDRNDAELMHCRRENLRLLEQISAQEKEITLLKIKSGENKDGLKEQSPLESEINSRISEIESKHVETVSELEGLIENQSQVMAQLKAECQSLTQKLEESTARHKDEMAKLQSNLEYLRGKLESSLGTQQWSAVSLTGDSSTRRNDALQEEDQYRNAVEGSPPLPLPKEEAEDYPELEKYPQEYEAKEPDLSYSQSADIRATNPDAYSGARDDGNGHSYDSDAYQQQNPQRSEYESQQSSYQGEQGMYSNYPSEFVGYQDEQQTYQAEESYPSQNYDQALPGEAEVAPTVQRSPTENPPATRQAPKAAEPRKGSAQSRSLRSVAQSRLQQKQQPVRSK